MTPQPGTPAVADLEPVTEAGRRVIGWVRASCHQRGLTREQIASEIAAWTGEVRAIEAESARRTTEENVALREALRGLVDLDSAEPSERRRPEFHAKRERLFAAARKLAGEENPDAHP